MRCQNVVSASKLFPLQAQLTGEADSKQQLADQARLQQDRVVELQQQLAVADQKAAEYAAEKEETRVATASLQVLAAPLLELKCLFVYRQLCSIDTHKDAWCSGPRLDTELTSIVDPNAIFLYLDTESLLLTENISFINTCFSRHLSCCIRGVTADLS